MPAEPLDDETQLTVAAPLIAARLGVSLFPPGGGKKTSFELHVSDAVVKREIGVGWMPDRHLSGAASLPQLRYRRMARYRPAWPPRPLAQENESPAARRQNHEEHRDERQLVRPAQAVLAPEAGFPNEHLLLNRTEHDENEPNRG